MKKIILSFATIALLTGCNTLKFDATKPDGTHVVVNSHRFVWSTEMYSANINSNSASLTASKSSVDAAAIGAAAEGVAKGLAASMK